MTLLLRATNLLATRCPYCRSVEFRKVGIRNSIERAVSWIVQPYRCALCGHHVYFFPWQSPTLED